MLDFFGKRFEEAFEHAYNRIEFKSFIFKRRMIAYLSFAVNIAFYIAVLIVCYILGNNLFNPATVVLLIVLACFCRFGGYHVVCNILEYFFARTDKNSLDGYGDFLIDILNTYFDEEFSAGSMDFNKTVYEESRPVNKEYGSCYSKRGKACISVKLKNGALVKILDICTNKMDSSYEHDSSYFWRSVFAVANIETYGRINICNYEINSSHYVSNGEFKMLVDEGSAYFDADRLMKFLENCDNMVNITAEREKVYVEIAERSVYFDANGKKKLVGNAEAVIKNVLLIINIFYCITGTVPTQQY